MLLGSSNVRLNYCATVFSGGTQNILRAYNKVILITTVESLPAYNTDEVEEGGEQDGRQLGVAHAEQLQEGVLDEVTSPVPPQLGRADVLHDVLQAEDAPHLWRKIQDVYRWIYPFYIL